MWKMLTKPETCPLARQREVNQHHHAQDDAVNAEGGEGVPAHIFHQSPDDKQAHQERHHAPHDQHADLGAGGGNAAEQKFQPLDGGRPQAMKKENSAPALRPTPMRIVPRMVEPEREVPGIRLRHWKQPMSRAVL